MPSATCSFRRCNHTVDKANLTSIVFGEMLYDCFPDRSYLGGAPLNFASNLRQLGFPVAMVSAVGRDELGQQARGFLRRADIDQQWVAERPEPTGTVDVLLDAGQPSYAIRADVAWDYIETKPALDRPPDLIYYGTAAQRSPANRPALSHLLATKPRHRLFDVNLRRGCYTPQTVLFGLEAATVVKLNDEEWEAVRDIAAVASPADLLARYELDRLAITSGRNGAQLHIPGASFAARPAPVSVVDAVGAGDAFSGVLAASTLLGTDPQQALYLACAAGASAVQHQGAHSPLPESVKAAFA